MDQRHKYKARHYTYENSERKTWAEHSDINCGKVFFDPPSKVMKIKNKKKHTEPN